MLLACIGSLCARSIASTGEYAKPGPALNGLKTRVEIPAQNGGRGNISWGGPPPGLIGRDRRRPRPDRLIAHGGTFQEGLQHAAAGGVPQLAQRLGFDLANALPGDGKALSDFFQRMLAPVAEPEPHLDDLLLPRGECLEDRLRLLFEIDVYDCFGRRNDAAVLDEVAEVAVFF